jgi:hypothetical protein
MPAQNLEVFKGAERQITMSVDVLGNNMTGVTGEMFIRHHGEIVLTLSSANAISIPDNAVKEFLITLSEDNLDDMDAGLHEYRIDATKDGQTVYQAHGLLYVRD